MKLNHVLIRASDLEKMRDFLVDIIGLEEGFRPPFSFPGIWLYSNKRPLVHLVRRDESCRVHSDCRCLNSSGRQEVVAHVALQGANYAGLIERLEGHHLVYVEQDVPLTAEHQVFVSGPDSLVLELLFTQDKKTITH